MSYPMLERINAPGELKNLPATDMPALGEELRQLLIKSVAETGGPLSASRGGGALPGALPRTAAPPPPAAGGGPFLVCRGATRPPRLKRAPRRRNILAGGGARLFRRGQLLVMVGTGVSSASSSALGLAR